jgi:hypothetical protein
VPGEPAPADHDATAMSIGVSMAGIHDCGIVLMASPTLARW